MKPELRILRFYPYLRGKKWAIFRSRVSSLTRLPSYPDGVRFLLKFASTRRRNMKTLEKIFQRLYRVYVCVCVDKIRIQAVL